MKEVRLKNGEPLTYTYEEEGNVAVGITPLKNGKLTNCKAEVFRVVRGVEAAESGIQIVLGDGKTYPVTAVTRIRE
jgi:hypothetical protein